MSEMREGLISIVVPVYNAMPFLDKMLQSIKEQTYSNWELLLIDDGSSDESKNYLENWIKSQGNKVGEHFQNHIRLFANQKNCGPAAARNVGIRAAKGRYLAFLDADDYWEKDKLEKQYLFMKQRNCAFSFTGYEFADRNGIRNGKVVHVPNQITYYEALTNTTISTITVMLDRGRISDQFLQMPEGCKREDTATWWNILKHGYTAHGLDEPLSVYCRHKGSHSANKLQAIKGTWEMYREQEQLPFGRTVCYMAVNLYRAAKRRI